MQTAQSMLSIKLTKVMEDFLSIVKANNYNRLDRHCKHLQSLTLSQEKPPNLTLFYHHQCAGILKTSKHIVAN